MNNLEFYEKELAHVSFAVVDNHVKNCGDTSCADCLFKEVHSCTGARYEWLNAEYTEPSVNWSNVAVDTPILVRDNGTTWHKRYFARYENNEVYAWCCGSTSWSASGIDDVSIWSHAKLAEVNNDEFGEMV